MKRKVFECGILFLISVSYVIALLYDNDIFDPFVLLSNNIEDQMNTIFQVQASVATLGIALISLLAGSYKETIYGVPVSRFIMHIRPYILKHRNIILFELFLILISYISIIFNYYNSLITTFLISILLIGVMVYDIFKIFNGDKYIEEAIKEHCLSICEDGQLGEKQGILNVISDDIKYAVDNNYFSRVKKDLNILQDLFIIINNNQSDNHINKFWEENYISICSYIFEQENNNINYLMLESITNLFKLKKSSFRIWNEIGNAYFKKLANIEYRDSLYRNILHLRYNLYTLEYDSKNNYSMLINFSSSVYYCLYVHNNYGQNRLKKSLYEAIDITYRYGEISVEMKKVAYNELCNYTKTLIDNREYDLLKETFIDVVERKTRQNNKESFIFLIFIYLYYLAEKEELVNEKAKEFAIDFINKHKSVINTFLYTAKYSFKIDKNLIDETKSIISSWEIFKTGRAKFVIMDYVVDEFFVFYIVTTEYDVNSLITDFNAIISEREFHFCSTFGSNSKERLRNQYKKFLELFYGKNLSDDALIERIDKLDSALGQVYKISELKKASSNDFSEFELTISSKIEQIKIEIIDKIAIFKNKPEQPKFYKKQIMKLNTFPNLVDINSLTTEIYHYFLRILIFLVYKKIHVHKVSYDDKDILNKFFDLLNTTKINVDTLIGYRNWFHNFEKEEDFKVFEDQMFKIKAEGFDNLLLTIDSSKFYVHLLDIKIFLEKIPEDDILEMAKLNSEGEYLYNITNDIYLPFKKDELIRYVTNTRRYIVVEVALEYGFIDETSNIGISFEITHEKR